MSLFGAPQVALPSALLPQDLPVPSVLTPDAVTEAVDVLPVSVPAGLPGALVAVAVTVVGGAAAAHVAALRARQLAAVATA
jgi:hypothetical protein